MEDKKGWVHIYPCNDIKKHYTGKIPGGQPIWVLSHFTPKIEPVYVSDICECKPIIDPESELIIHNAWDCREAVEEAERILAQSC